MTPDSRNVHIIGAGFSGLSLAYLLAKKGFTVNVFEISDRPGGLISTKLTPWGLAESAANSILSSQSTIDFLNEIEASIIEPLTFSKKRFFFNGEVTRWPLHLWQTIQFVFKVIQIILFKKKSAPHALETLQSWGDRNLGSSANQLLLAPAMQGIYAGDHSQLSASLILGSLFSGKRSKFIGLRSGRNGMQDIIAALYRACLKKGVQFHLNVKSAPLTSLDLKTPTILAVSANDAAVLLKNVAPKVSQILAAIPMNSLITSTLFFESPQILKQGFGVLIPKIFGFHTLGILMNTYIFPNRNQKYNETYILGGATNPEITTWDENKILDQILKERNKLLNDSSKPLGYSTTKWMRALPHYSIELEKLLNQLNSIEFPNNLFLHGNYLGGIGLSKILDRSMALAKEIASNES